MTTTYVIAAYEIDRAYGGPEEGGWWFNTGQLIKVLKTCKSEDEAYRIARNANGWLNVLQRGCRDVGSIIYDGGRIGVSVYENTAPPFYPETRPHYE